MLATAARLADIVTLNIPLSSDAGLATNTVTRGTRARFEERLGVVHRAAAAAGRTVELHVYVHHVHLGDGWRDAADEEAARLALTFAEYVASPHVLAGDVDEIASIVLARRDELGLGYFSVPASVLEPFAPVVARLTG